MKEKYIEYLEKVLDAYSTEHIKRYYESVVENSIEEHGYPRVVANLGMLIAHGRKTELKDLFVKMMDLCCEQIPVAFGINGKRVGNDFSVKEIVICILELEKMGTFDKSYTNRWRNELAKIDPYKTYSEIAPVPPVPVNNWAAFGAVSEQLRKYAGIGDESDFIENQIASQMFSFDENGMYRDPHEPIVYDFVPRLQLAIALWYGYDGKYKEAIENELEKSAEITLSMQSVTGEIPFGGRSNQFLHNDTLYLILCEFYASYYKQKGNIEMAARFKKAAQNAFEIFCSWFDGEQMYHVKNCYPNMSMIGCEDYAYFDKYMVTAGSWLMIAYMMADDSIEPADISVKKEYYVCETSEYFHLIFCRCGDYFVQIDKSANYHYDASGIGRIHKKGIPPMLCLSLPFAKEPNYIIDIENKGPLSICGGIKTKDGFVYSCEEDVEYVPTDKKEQEDCVQICFECKKNERKLFDLRCAVKNDGVTVVVEGDGEVSIMFPVFAFDGKTKSEITADDVCVKTVYKGKTCRFISDNKIVDKNEIYANRNGHYNAYAVCGQDKVTLKIDMF